MSGQLNELSGAHALFSNGCAGPELAPSAMPKNRRKRNADDDEDPANADKPSAGSTALQSLFAASTRFAAPATTLVPSAAAGTSRDQRRAKRARSDTNDTTESSEQGGSNKVAEDQEQDVDERGSNAHEEEDENENTEGSDDDDVDEDEDDSEQDDERHNISDEEANMQQVSKDNCTIFVGNLPTTVKGRKLRALFRAFGAISSVRFRSAALASVPIASKNDGALLRRAAFIQGKFSDEQGAASNVYNAYVVFEEPEAVAKALSLNGTAFEGRTLRVDRVSGSADRAKNSVFVGNLPYDVDEDELRAFFGARVAGGATAVQSVRIVRDRVTREGKGFGYVLFAGREHVPDALGLNEAKFKGRKLRVLVCGKRTKVDAARNAGRSLGWEGDRASINSLSGGAERRLERKRRRLAAQSKDGGAKGQGQGKGKGKGGGKGKGKGRGRGSGLGRGVGGKGGKGSGSGKGQSKGRGRGGGKGRGRGRGR